MPRLGAKGWVRQNPPAAPVNVHISKATSTELEFSWDAPPGCVKGDSLQGYEIHYQVKGFNPKRRLVDAFTNKYVIRGLNPGTQVTGISIKARNDTGWGQPSLPAITGQSASAPPGQVDWIEVIEVFDFSAKLKWAQPISDNGAPIENYKIQVYQPGVQDSATEVETGDPGCEFTVWSLKPGTAYMFTVCAQNESGWGPWVSLPAYGLTKSAPPNEPSDVKVVKTTVDTAQLSWKKPFGNGSEVVGYEVLYEDDARKMCSRIYNPPQRSAEPLVHFTLSHLHAGSMVAQIQVRARNLAGWSALSHPPLTAFTSGKLVGWGCGDRGQLGGGTDEHHRDATEEEEGNLSVLTALRDKLVTAIAAGGGHSAALCEGEVYTWGSNDCGQLGRFAGRVDAEPAAIQIKGYEAMQTGSAVAAECTQLLAHPHIQLLRQDGPTDYLGSLGPLEKTQGGCIGVAAGEKHTLVLTEGGEVFAFGDGTFGSLGQGDERAHSVPKLVDFLANPGFVVEQVACGERHSACIVRGGQALTWGCGLHGQLGHCSHENGFYPRKVEHLAGEHVTRVACGSKHSCFAAASGRLYSCGDGRDGKLGHGDDKGYVFPKWVEALEGVVEVACGAMHSACIARGRRLYTWGSGTQGQLGYAHGEIKDIPVFSTLGASSRGAWRQSLPRCVAALCENREAGGVQRVECGPSCTLAVTRDHSLWVWGEGDQVAALLGLEDAGVGEPVRARMGGGYLTLLSAGARHGLALLTGYPPSLVEAGRRALEPGGEQARQGSSNSAAEGEEEDELDELGPIDEVMVSSVQEGCFWARRIGLPLYLSSSELAYRRHQEGQRSPEVVEHVVQCFTEMQLRAELKRLLVKEEKRLLKEGKTAPKVLVAKLRQAEAALSEEERSELDASTKEMLAELEERRAQKAIKDAHIRAMHSQANDAVSSALTPPSTRGTHT